ncbi:(d)CMP kinase [Thiotrichales bacterium 19S3-7]|nr:(d)CMP kinase [Thiotrichales bacterium 19S3-7]MCF6803055.1 (d)CMP kinase [Thiotrichales bacterium 19S3-11]
MTDKIITIDGPSGVGKGTLARYLAAYLNWCLLDSGAIYRALAYFSNVCGIDSNNVNALSEAALNLPVSFLSKGGETRVIIDKKDVTDFIRAESVGMLASKISAYQPVRDSLMKLQQSFNRGDGLIADGRDMGTIVFPNAQVKLFLDAASELRAKRRYQQLTRQGVVVDEKAILEQVIQRDHQDRNRQVAPLIPATDAVIIDTSSLNIDQVQQKALEILKKNAICC